MHDFRPATQEEQGENMFGDSFRNYEKSARQEAVEENYGKRHTMMMYEFVKEKQEKEQVLCELKAKMGTVGAP